jgi:hypothetical protein
MLSRPTAGAEFLFALYESIAAPLLPGCRNLARVVI